MSHDQANKARNSRKITSGWKRPDTSKRNYKKGFWITKAGYIGVMFGGRETTQHRKVMEQHLGRRLTTEEHIHHTNFNKQDNRIENLKIMSNSEHLKLHQEINNQMVL